MYTLVRSFPARFWLQQLPIAGTSMLIAEMFYKFHSFVLETMAFCATWYVLDAAVNVLRSRKK